MCEKSDCQGSVPCVPSRALFPILLFCFGICRVYHSRHTPLKLNDGFRNSDLRGSSPRNSQRRRAMIRPLEHRSNFPSIRRNLSSPRTPLYSTSKGVTKNLCVYTRLPSFTSISCVPIHCGQICGSHFCPTNSWFHKAKASPRINQK